MNVKTYLHYIVKFKINKKSDIQINIPTFNGYKTTKKTIKVLYNQKNINFDILIIDNNSNDYERLIKDFPDLNYILLKENTGSSGAQRIGAEIALKHKYDYIVFTDNDAILLDEYGLFKMKKNFADNQVVAVVPQNIELQSTKRKEAKIKRLNGPYPLHYLFTKLDVFKKVQFHNFYMFLSGDDTSLTTKLLSTGKVLIDQSVLFYHPIFKRQNTQNKTMFLSLRSLIIVIFFERNIKLKWRFRAFLHASFVFLQAIFYTIKFLDVSYIKTLFFVLTSFVYGYKNINKLKELLEKMPQNKYVFEEVARKDLKQNEIKSFVNILSNFWLLLFVPLKFCFYSNYLKRNIFFKIRKVL